MNKKTILFFTIFLTLLIVNSANAEENTTDIIEDNDTETLSTITQEENTEPLLANTQETNTMTNAIWVRGADMENVNFNTIKNANIDTILLNFAAINRHGKEKVTNWVNTANTYGINVHIWMQVCYHGGFENPLTNGELNTALLTRDIQDAIEFASIPGIKGINLDYMRYPGTASKNPGGTATITFFVTRLTETIKNVNSSLIVSGSLMPEPSSLISAYGQNLSALSEVLDYIIPMVYKGNYKQNSAWITQVTKYFVENSKKSKIITGLQTYKSDNDLTKLSTTALQEDVDASYNGGAIGVCLFRYGLTNFINFKKEVDLTKHIQTILTGDEFTHYYEETAGFTGTIKDNEGNPIAGQHISLKLTRTSSGASKTYDVVSDYLGGYYLPITLAIGTYSVEANYDGVVIGNTTYDKSNTVISNLIVLNNNLTNVSLIANNYNEIFNSGNNFTGYLYDNESNPIAGHTVKVTLQRTTNTQSKTYNIVTDYLGEYRLSINLSPGEYLAFCTYEGTDKYQAKSTNATITVEKEYETLI